MNNSDTNKNQIINMNDYIFRQNLEFYPNLQGLTCKDNVIYYVKDGNIIASTALNFDLRAIPTWNTTPEEFIKIINLNKECEHLDSFENLIHTFANVELTPEVEKNLSNYMNLYFTAQDSFHNLTDFNKNRLESIKITIASLPKTTPMGISINLKLDEYFEITKNIGDTRNMNETDELRQGNALVRIKNETTALVPTKTSSRAAFVNISILLYGVINIGLILALALMK